MGCSMKSVRSSTVRLILAYLLIGVSLWSAEPPNYYQNAAGLTGAALRTALNTIIKTGHSPVTYDEARYALAATDQDPADSNRLILIYSWESKHANNDWINNNSTDGWNREHLWPNSLGIDGNSRAYPDLFNLRPCDEQVNGDRANMVFDESSPGTTGYQKPANAEATNCTQDSDSWEPPSSMKGDIARSLFYMDVRYEGASNEPDLKLTDNLNLINNNAAYIGRLSTLLVWHFLDPVDDKERLRNDRVQTQQGNRNPFIDHPEWVEAIFGPVFQITLQRAGANVQLRWPAQIQDTMSLIEMSSSLSPNASWTKLTGTPSLDGIWRLRTLPLSSKVRFYRLKLTDING